MSKLNELPESINDYWQDAEKHSNKPVAIPICQTHTVENWMDHVGYKQEGNTALCTKCPWGTPLPGHLRVIFGKIINLRAM